MGCQADAQKKRQGLFPLTLLMGNCNIGSCYLFYAELTRLVVGVDQGLLSALAGFMYQLLFWRYLRFFDRSSCFVDIAYAGSCPGYVLSSREGRCGSKKYKSGFPVFGNKQKK